jgi:hypothetical protein
VIRVFFAWIWWKLFAHGACAICAGADKERCVPREDVKLIARWGRFWLNRCPATLTWGTPKQSLLCCHTRKHDGGHFHGKGDGALWQ